MDYTCTCDEGYEGKNCETDTDDCVSVLCGGHGTCLDGLASFTCSCETGYSGELCEELGECGVRRGRGRGIPPWPVAGCAHQVYRGPLLLL